MTTQDTLSGTLFAGRYRISRKLGGGGMADVYLAEDQELGRRVAIKMLHNRYANDERMIEAMKKKAAKLGADAIIIGEFKDPSTVEKVADAAIGVGDEKTAKVLAIRLKS